MKRSLTHLFLIAVLGTSLCSTAQQSAKADPLAPVQFLVGNWVGQGGGQPGQASSGGFTYESDVQKRVLVRKNFAEYPATKERPAFRHDDLMVVYAENGALKAIYWDNEGHVIRYVVTRPSVGEAVFTSEAAPGPRFRLTQKLSGENSMVILFDIQAPGTDGFTRYIEASASRK